ncbi:AAA family ATPase, partial [Nocardia nova]|nr:AAA family ATPase [Nocardia nova]
MTSPTATAPATSTRLGNGELRRMVARVLADHPAVEYSPREIAKLISRSSGAVGNALKTLTAAGQAEQTNATPLRYRATADSAAAAAGATAPTPAAPAP